MFKDVAVEWFTSGYNTYNLVRMTADDHLMEYIISTFTVHNS